MRANYPEDWSRCYLENQHYRVDPVVQHGEKSTRPLVWNSEMLAAVPEFSEQARLAGVRYGWAQSSRGEFGRRSILAVARAGEPLGESELIAIEPRLVWLAQGAHQATLRIAEPEAAPVQLSAREVEVLRWTGIGKTASEVADIMNISDRTANFHIANAIAKLQVANKTAAVLRAAVLGLLW
jgi:LuxR family transcriptional regulator